MKLQPICTYAARPALIFSWHLKTLEPFWESSWLEFSQHCGNFSKKYSIFLSCLNAQMPIQLFEFDIVIKMMSWNGESNSSEKGNKNQIIIYVPDWILRFTVDKSFNFWSKSSSSYDFRLIIYWRIVTLWLNFRKYGIEAISEHKEYQCNSTKRTTQKYQSLICHALIPSSSITLTFYIARKNIGSMFRLFWFLLWYLAWGNR